MQQQQKFFNYNSHSLCGLRDVPLSITTETHKVSEQEDLKKCNHALNSLWNGKIQENPASSNPMD